MFTTVSLAQQAGPASNARVSGAGLEKVVFMPPSLKARGVASNANVVSGVLLELCARLSAPGQ